MRYRRAISPGETFFFTVVTYQRTPVFVNDRRVELLREAFRYVLGKHPFEIVACVILSEHIHTIWEHQIRDEHDFNRHVEYIHYNPVKHGLVNTPVEWKYSSFHAFVRNGIYPADWGAGEEKGPELYERIE